jgi:hypothetical protein
MNSAQIASLVRALLLSAGAVLVKKGFVDDAGLTSSVDSLIGLGLVIIPLIWSHFVHKDTPPPDAPKPPTGTGSGLASVLILGAVLAFASMGLTGCGTLDKSGPYAGDKVLYVADQTDVTAYNVIHSFVSFEYENRAALAGHPEIKAAADDIRAQAPLWFARYDQARTLYVTVNTPENLARFNAALDQLKAGVAKATSFLFTAQTLTAK